MAGRLKHAYASLLAVDERACRLLHEDCCPVTLARCSRMILLLTVLGTSDFRLAAPSYDYAAPRRELTTCVKKDETDSSIEQCGLLRRRFPRTHACTEVSALSRIGARTGARSRTTAAGASAEAAPCASRVPLATRGILRTRRARTGAACGSTARTANVGQRAVNSNVGRFVPLTPRVPRAERS